MRVKTPCIGLCSTTYGDMVCKGCKRYDQEIVKWNSYSEEEKRDVIDRLSILAKIAVEQVVSITDPELLKSKIKENRIPHKPQLGVHSYVISLLRSHAKAIEDTADFGFHVLPMYAHLSMGEVRKRIKDKHQEITIETFQQLIDNG